MLTRLVCVCVFSMASWALSGPTRVGSVREQQRSYLWNATSSPPHSGLKKVVSGQ